MGRPFYPHEIEDPDLDWLVSNFLYEKPGYMPVESGVLPLILLPYNENIEKPKEIEEEESDDIGMP